MPLISVENLSKTYRTFDRSQGLRGAIVDFFHRNYRDVRAVDSISFSIEPGELVGYIGPNGAGKSTTIKMLTGILLPTSGRISVSGYEPARQRREYTRHIGVVFGQRTQLWWDIAVMESFRLLKKIYRVKDSDFRYRLDRFRDVLDIDPLLRIPVRKLSLGQRMRCDLVASLLHEPEILFLDEPTIGLDIIGRQHIRDFLEHINREIKTTIILTTHNLDEIERLCRRILIIDHGHILYDGQLQTLKEKYSRHRSAVLHLREAQSDESQASVKTDLCEINPTFTSDRELLVKLDSENMTLPRIIEQVGSILALKDVALREPSIDDIIARIYTDGDVVSQ